MTNINDLPPFRYDVTPQPVGEEGASAGQINEQVLEDYLARLLDAIKALEARVTALEGP